MRLPLRTTIIWLLGWTLGPGSARAADALPPLQADPALLAPVLRAAGGMPPHERDARHNYPNFISSDRMHGRQDVETVAEGDAELRTIGRSVNSDQLTYWPLDDEVEAVGNVRLVRDQDIVTGPKMRLKLEDNVGYFEQPRYSMTRMPKPVPALIPGAAPGAPRPPPPQPVTGFGQADKLDFEGEGLYRMKNATYSTCSPQKMDWFAQMDQLKLDYNRQVAEADNALITFHGVPLLYSPWLSFSLNRERKSGLLTPTFGSTSRGGFEFIQPWYWNIAPNIDATIAPRLIERRGVLLNSELRYQGRNYFGEVHNEFIPRDRLYDDQRYSYSMFHNQNFGYGLSGSLNLNGVSDATYFTDMARQLVVVSQGNLLRQGALTYAGGWWNASVIAQRYQAPQTPLDPPYARLPVITLSANRPNAVPGVNLSGVAEYTDFGHPTRVDGQRWVAYPQVSMPFQTPAFFVTPKLGVHATRYVLDEKVTALPKYLARSVPIASIDSGIFLERDFPLLNRQLVQTLEPRLFYAYIPYRDQANFPVFDTGRAGYDAAQIFAENRYAGHDRIGDANQLTAMLTSRLIDQQTGVEMLRGGVGQRYYFRSEAVTLPGEVPRDYRTANLLATLSGQVAQKAFVDSNWQYSPHFHRTEVFNVGARYQPEIGKVLNAGYRYTFNSLEQVDVSGQWPVWGGWTGVGRFNYSLKDTRIVETVAGVEYDGGCWAARAVMQRLPGVGNTSSTAFFVQLELNGFSKIGSDPLKLLQRNVPGYYGQASRATADPVFSTN